MPLTTGLVKQGLVADPAGVASAINTLFSEKKLSPKGVVVSLAGLRSVLRIVTLPKLKASMLDEAIRHEAEREMPVPLDELYISRQTLRSGDPEQRHLVLGVPRDLLDSQVRTLARAGVKARSVNLKPLALARAVNREEALIMNLEQDVCDLVVVADGVPATMRTVMLRGNDVALEDTISQVTGELSRTVQFHNSSNPGRSLGPATPVFLTGLLATDAAARYLVKAAIDNPIETLAPPLECPPELPVAQYAVNIGLALGGASSILPLSLGGARSEVINPNVLPGGRGTLPLSPARMLYPAAAVVFIVLMLIMYQMKSGSQAEIASIQDELATVNWQVSEASRPADPLVASISEAQAEVSRIKAERLSILGALNTSNLGDSLLRVISALPPGVGLTSIIQTEDEISLGGTANSRPRVADYVVALEQTGLFSEVYAASLSSGEDGSIAFTILGHVDATQ
jgi:Tfp pilus assembly PilM family ATPase/Tfp pilus assembly protein PilN